MTISMTEIKNLWQSKHISKKQTFIAAAVFHILFSALIYLIGTSELFPSMFDTRGIGEFASDGVQYIREITSLLEMIRNFEANTFFVSTSSFHVKLYAISFVVLEPLFGYTILGGELINLGLYLAILWFVYTLGKELFNPTVGHFSLMIIGLWPSFLLYTTQLYKTPLFIATFFALTTSLLRILKSPQNKWRLFIPVTLSLISILTLWFIRNEWWSLFLIYLGLALIFLFGRMLIDRQFRIAETIVMVLLLVTSLAIQRYANDLLHSLTAHYPPANKIASISVYSPVGNQPFSLTFGDATPIPLDKANSGEAQLELSLFQDFVAFLDKLKAKADNLARRIGDERYGYARNSRSGSNLDTDYQIENMADLVRYQPRALVVGLFAPFPKMWLTGGAKLGLSARMLSGSETVFMYAIYPFAFLGVWHTRKQLSAWYLVLIVLVSATALGTVVVNIGALYRFRYAFWMLVIIFGVGGYNLVALPYVRSIIDKRRLKSPRT
jgi:hypothetical protein